MVFNCFNAPQTGVAAPKGHSPITISAYIIEKRYGSVNNRAWADVHARSGFEINKKTLS